MHSIGKPHPACESFDLTPEASTATRFATNLHPRYACLISFLSLMLVFYCSSLLLMWTTYTAGTQQNSGFIIQLELDSCISALSYYLVKSVYTYTETFKFQHFFLPAQKNRSVTQTKNIPDNHSATMRPLSMQNCFKIAKKPTLFFLSSWTWATSQTVYRKSEW